MPEEPLSIERTPISSSLLNYKPKQSLSSSIKLQNFSKKWGWGSKGLRPWVGVWVNISIAQTYSTVYDKKH